jgi:excisionase family DNA binding protein
MKPESQPTYTLPSRSHREQPAGIVSEQSKKAKLAMEERFLSFGAVRQLLGVSRATLWRWETERGLKVVRIGSVARVRESDLQAFIERHESGKSQGVAEQSQSRP